MIAKLIGSNSDEIAFTQSTSCGLNIAINSITWKKGDNVVFPEWEHTPPVTSTILRNNVEPRAVKAVNEQVELADLEKTIDDSTKLVCVSQVSYINGFRWPAWGFSIRRRDT